MLQKTIIIVTIILLIVTNYFCISFYKEKETLANAKMLIQDSLQSEIKYWKDKEGKSHSSTLSVIVNEKNKSIVFSKQASKLKIKPSDVNSQTNVSILHDTTLISKTDTIYIGKNKVVRKEYKDEWNKIGIIGDSLYISIKDKWVLTSYMKRPHWYSLSKKLYRDVETSNPLIKVVDVKDWQTKKENPIILIAPYIGVGYNPFKNNFYPSVGIAVTYYKISYKIY